MIEASFAPTTPVALWGVGGVIVALVALGWPVQAVAQHRVPPGRMLAWGATALGLVVVQLLTVDQPAGYRMLALCAALLYGMKLVVVCAAVHPGGGHVLGPWQWLVFACAWMGMRARVFRDLGGQARPGVRKLALLGGRNVAVGAALFAVGRWAMARGYDGAAIVSGMVGLSLMVHFGLFHIQAALLRAKGVGVGPLFRDPIRSASLAEFWGRRWNLAFSEMTAQAVYRPLRQRLGDGPAMTAAFLFSGLLHELAISGPVNAGWGLPMLYFALHAVVMRVERRLQLSGLWAHLWTMGWVLAPTPLLFHGPFVAGVVAPLLR